MPESSIRLRTARETDLPELQRLVRAAIAELLAPFLSAEQLRASHDIMGIDTQLIADGTYYVAEIGEQVAGCGGWSRRATHFGGGHSPGRDGRALDPTQDAARVRAMYTRPAFARRGIGRAILARCETSAGEEGFRAAALVSTMAGVSLYRACGYREIEHLAEMTPSGIAVPLVRMRKEL